MSAGTAPRRSTPASRQFPELSVVALVRRIEVDGRALPAGAMGTVVGVYKDGVAYEVEFQNPFHAVVTLEAGDLSA